MSRYNKMIITILLTSVASGSFSHAKEGELGAGVIIGGIGGIAITLAGVWIKSLLERRPLDLSGSIYRENMRPKEGFELPCRDIVKYLEILDHGLTLNDQQGQSATKEELGKQKVAYLNKYNLECNKVNSYSKLF